MKVFWAFGFVTLLSGCGWLYGKDGIIRDRANEYLKAQPAPRMEIPEGLPANNHQQDYLVIPSLPEAAQTTPPEDFEIPTPPPLLATADDARVATESVSLADMPVSSDADAPVQLVEDGSGNAALQFNQDFDTTWDAIGEALKAADIKVVDLNRTLEIYNIEYDDMALQLNIKANGAQTLVTVSEEQKAAALGLSQEVLQKIKTHLPQQ